MKHGNTHFLQLSRALFTDKYNHLSLGAKYLFVVLNELEQRYTTGRDGGEDWFFRTDADLAKDVGVSEATLKRYKAELKKTDLVRIGRMHWTNPETGKKSEKKLTSYRILK